MCFPSAQTVHPSQMCSQDLCNNCHIPEDKTISSSQGLVENCPHVEHTQSDKQEEQLEETPQEESEKLPQSSQEEIAETLPDIEKDATVDTELQEVLHNVTKERDALADEAVAANCHITKLEEDLSAKDVTIRDLQLKFKAAEDMAAENRAQVTVLRALLQEHEPSAKRPKMKEERLEMTECALPLTAIPVELEEP